MKSVREKVVRDKEPQIDDAGITAARAFLKNNGLPENGYLKVVGGADIRGYATIDLKTGLPAKDLTDGYMVSFQVNKTVNVRRDYTPDEYDKYVYEGVSRTGSIPYLGTYGNAEISFCAKDYETAMQMAEDYNQKSVFDIARDREIINDIYNYDTNPTEKD
jgi:hypothetical protein